MDRIRIIHGDITTLEVDAIVNAANSALLPGGGVDGAIRRKAGNELNEDLYRIGRCPTGQAVITPGYDLPARRVIHTVAPIWRSGDKEQDALLASCYDSVLALADEYQIATVAFPAIGTGAYGWPSDVAAKIAVGCVTNHLANCAIQDFITFCCFTAADLAACKSLLNTR